MFRVTYTRKGVLKKRQTITWSLPAIHLAFCIVLKGLHTQCRVYLTEGDEYTATKLGFKYFIATAFGTSFTENKGSHF